MLRTIHRTCRRCLPTVPFSTLSHPLFIENTKEEDQHEDPFSLMKADPIELCSQLWVSSFSNPNKTLSNLTGFLRKFDLWILAYQRAHADEVGSFPPRNAIHFSTLKDLLSLRNAVLHSQYLWGMKIRHVYIQSPRERELMRPISRRRLKLLLDSDKTPFQDSIVQEVLHMILEPFFEPRFSQKSYAFRPGRNAHTVIRVIRSNFAGYLWFLKGDLSSVFNRIEIDALVDCLTKAVKDRKVISLIRSALKTPVKTVNEEDDSKKSSIRKKREKKKKKKKKGTSKKILDENEPKPDPYWLRTFFGFAPEEAAKVPTWGHCGILGPLIANICLNELDFWMENKISCYFQPSRCDSIWKNSIEDGSHNPSWPEFVPTSGPEKTKKMDYIRYGAHILIGIRGPREDALEIRKQIMEFCEKVYGVMIDNSSLEIEHITRGIQFLDHIICQRVIYPTLRYTSTGGKVVSEKGVGTLLSVTASLPQCIRQFRKLEFVKGDRDPEPLPCTPMLYASQAHTNSQMNKFLETMADWYRYADNRKKVVGFCAYVIRSSLAKLYAARYRLRSRAKVYKLASRDLSRPLKETSGEAPEYTDLLRMGLVDAIDGVQFVHMSSIPTCDYTPFPTNWIPDHERLLHEYTMLQSPKYFCHLRRSIKQQGVRVPQEDLARLVWEWKVKATLRGQSSKGNMRRQNQYASSAVNPMVVAQMQYMAAQNASW
ncbi:hypothetical protein AMTRI_Chr10g224680 [Amborella trichopoda]